MAKISSYPSDAQVTTSDRLIGSDNENSNETKNFSVGDIISLAQSIIAPSGSFVPYTGAVGDVDLGNYNLTANNVQADIFQLNSGGILGLYGTLQLNGSPGAVGQVLTSSGGGVPTWTTLPSLTGYVPYAGATGDVQLGSHSLFGNIVYGTTVIGNTSIQSNGALIVLGPMQLGASIGTTGQVLTSAGSNAPTWTTLPNFSTFVPYTGATGAVNLGIYSLTAANVGANNVVPVLGGSGDIYFGGTGGYGVAYNGMYCTGPNTGITILGNSTPGAATQIEIDAFNNSISFLNGYVNVGGINGLLLSNGFGASGSVLVSNNIAAPSWNTIDNAISMPNLSAYSNLTQTIGASNTGQAMVLNQVVSGTNLGVSLNAGGVATRITFSKSGMYNIQFSAQIQRTSGGSSQTVDIWFRKGGSDIANSNTSINVQANAGYLVASWNFFYYMDVTQSNPYIEIMWATTDISIQLAAAVANAVHPATPSVIVTVNKVSN